MEQTVRPRFVRRPAHRDKAAMNGAQHLLPSEWATCPICLEMPSGKCLKSIWAAVTASFLPNACCSDLARESEDKRLYYLQISNELWSYPCG